MNKLKIFIILIIIISVTLLFSYAIVSGNQYYKDNRIPISSYTLQANVTLTRNDSWYAGIQKVNGQDIIVKLSNGTSMILLSDCQYFKSGDNITILFTKYIDTESNSIQITYLNLLQDNIPINLSCGYVSKL